MTATTLDESESSAYACNDHLQFTNIGEVGERRFLGADTSDLRRLHDESLLLSGDDVWILFAHDVENSGQQLVVSVVALGALPQALGVGLGHELLFLLLLIFGELEQQKMSFQSKATSLLDNDLPRKRHFRLP